MNKLIMKIDWMAQRIIAANDPNLHVLSGDTCPVDILARLLTQYGLELPSAGLETGWEVAFSADRICLISEVQGRDTDLPFYLFRRTRTPLGYAAAGYRGQGRWSPRRQYTLGKTG